ncbi:MAG: hypothetical protein KF912_08395 [Phycisphaeraceae bacterium]|nr:hypothetical protein [Phycisphaeraceae bacterium]MBX3367319.1 hypothetical protein [Phycisphaeraceae bacterium]
MQQRRCRMNVFDRVRQDEAKGDLASAKNRLCSHVVTTRFEPHICEQIARICVRMQDPTEAGRWYFLCDSVDAESAPCIETFRAAHAHRPAQILSQLPRGIQHKPLQDWTPSVGERLQKIGFKHLPTRGEQPSRSTLTDNLYPLGCAIFFLVGIALAFIGLRTVVGWLQ